MDERKQLLRTTIQNDFPDADEKVQKHMLQIIELAFECSELLTGQRPSEAKAKAIVAQLKSFLQLLSMD